ncbi:unnamed protein product [Notodromas monacha]|uniref:Peptidase S1 domain-containing protein n=1 Tax=Notodromas monacha TaxID=399045 RepID=A0A7R9BJ62_9CRUS|nr:unnamed protein product [Notodromas monacha]CAG0915110.1 unnamed protein product [Notodromas monacha]
MVKEVAFTDYIAPINLAPPNPVQTHPEGFPAIFLGWGSTEKDVRIEDLLFVETDLRSTDICEYYYSCSNPRGPKDFQNLYQLCYGGQGNHERCKNDAAGGPVLVTELGYSAVQIAINSYNRNASIQVLDQCVLVLLKHHGMNEQNFMIRT